MGVNKCLKYRLINNFDERVLFRNDKQTLRRFRVIRDDSGNADLSTRHFSKFKK